MFQTKIIGRVFSNLVNLKLYWLQHIDEVPRYLHTFQMNNSKMYTLVYELTTNCEEKSNKGKIMCPKTLCLPKWAAQALWYFISNESLVIA